MSQSNQLSSEPQNQLACYTYGVGHSSAEGVCLLVYCGAYRILLDCGLENILPLLENSTPPADLVICSHAHGDHARGLLELHRAFPQLPIYTSEVTAKLLFLNWLEEKVTVQWCQTLKWRSPKKLNQQLTVELFPAGHLPGAACVLLTYKTPARSYKLFYTGDFCLSNLQLVDGLSLENLRGIVPDVLIIEGSYGTARHPHRRQQEKQLMQRLKQALDQGQSILLPVPILGLAQEILKLLRSHHQFTGQDLDIWVDELVAIACNQYLELIPYFPSAVQNFAKHQPLFWDERVCPRMLPLSLEQISNLGKTPSIVMTDYHNDLQKYCHSGSWLILVPQKLSLEQIEEVENLPHIQVETYLLAQHSDIRNSIQLIHNLRPQHIIFVHTSPTYSTDLTSVEELQTRYQLHSPETGVLVELPIGEKFIQPKVPPQNKYEGELNEYNSFVTITLPNTIITDSRWNDFSDTGIVEASWQGEELVIRGVSQRELLHQTSESKRPVDIDCCNICYHFRNQRCWNQASPLYGFKVTPEGYCPVFEPRDTNS